MDVNWDALDAQTLEWLHAWGRDNEIRAHGYGDQLDDYLGAVEQGVTWDPHDMAGTPESPRASALDPDGRRYTSEVGQGRTGHESGGFDPDSSEAGVDYESWTKKDLQSELEKRNLPTSGNKDDLVLRLMDDDDAGDDGDVAPYEEWSEEELRAECRERGMRTGGDKDALVKALYDYDKHLHAKTGDEK